MVVGYLGCFDPTNLLYALVPQKSFRETANNAFGSLSTGLDEKPMIVHPSLTTLVKGYVCITNCFETCINHHTFYNLWHI